MPFCYGLYRFLGWFFFAVCFPPFLFYSVLTGRHLTGLKQRLGFWGKVKAEAGRPLRIWLHAASVGEVKVAGALIAELAAVLPGTSFILSTCTEYGREVARRQSGAGVRCIYAPFDLVGVVNRALKIWRPAVYICIETELWPNIIRQAGRSGVKVVLLNGRLTERSWQRYRLVRGFMKEVLAHFSLIAVIQNQDAARYLALGADPEKVVICGNAKYSMAGPCSPADTEKKYRAWLGLEDGTASAAPAVFMTGSTRRGEEEMLLEVFRTLRVKVENRELLWVLAPRHLERLREIEALFDREGIEYNLLSAVKDKGRGAAVVIVDVMGELAGLYSVATYVFCGGSLVKRGGHNVMEAAVWGRPVFYGPSTEDFSDAVAALEAVQAGFLVKQPGELADRIHYFMEHPAEYEAAGQRARAAALAQQRAARQQAMLVRDLLDAGSGKR